jgi:uncharacterized membrane protein
MFSHSVAHELEDFSQICCLLYIIVINLVLCIFVWRCFMLWQFVLTRIRGSRNHGFINFSFYETQTKVFSGIGSFGLCSHLGMVVCNRIFCCNNIADLILYMGNN